MSLFSQWEELINGQTDETFEEFWKLYAGTEQKIYKSILAEKNPVVSIELVPADQYEAGGADVIGNTNGDIYKLTWNVKDDSMLRTDSYSLRYNVTVNVEEEGFNPNADHPANGNTYVTYDDGGYNEIEVPDVNIPAYTVRYETTQETLQETEDLFEGEDIPGYLGEEPEKDGFAFTGWKLTSGTPTVICA